MGGWGVNWGGGFAAVVEDGETSGYGWALARFELDVILGFCGVRDGVQEDVVALARANLEVGCVY